MEKIPKRVYTKEFKEQAAKLVVEGGQGLTETARRLYPKGRLRARSRSRHWRMGWQWPGMEMGHRRATNVIR